ncbi:MAG: arginase [Ardenticatenaceae bacterium]
MNNVVHVLGVPMDLGQSRRGVDMGPFALRYAGLASRLERLGYQVVDKGNLDVPLPEEEGSSISSGLRHLPVVAHVNRQLAERCVASIGEGAIPLTLGGDHSIAAGTIAGICSSARAGVLWVDAHADINNPDTSPSKNLHGMPFGALLGQSPRELAPFGGAGRLDARDAIILGLRSVDPEERSLLRAHGVRVYTMRDVDELGIAEVTRQILNYCMQRGLERLHVSFDLDVLDPTIAPGVGTPVPGGLSYREAHLVMEMLADDGRVGSVDVVEINPILDIHNQTADLAVELVASLLGQSIL